MIPMSRATTQTKAQVIEHQGKIDGWFGRPELSQTVDRYKATCKASPSEGWLVAIGG